MTSLDQGGHGGEHETASAGRRLCRCALSPPSALRNKGLANTLSLSAERPITGFVYCALVQWALFCWVIDYT